MGVGQAIENIADAVAAQLFAFPANQAVTQAEKIIANVDRCVHAMASVQRGLSVTEAVVVLDIVVYKRRFVEDFHGQGGSLDRVTQSELVPAVASRGACLRAS